MYINFTCTILGHKFIIVVFLVKKCAFFGVYSRVISKFLPITNYYNLKIKLKMNHFYQFFLGISEHAISSVFEYTCRMSGAEHGAFPPVVAGGPRATHIHYIANNQLLHKEDMLLIDAGN